MKATENVTPGAEAASTALQQPQEEYLRWLSSLPASQQTTELLMSLREFCNKRLKERGEAALVVVDEERQELARDANLEMLALADLLQKEIIERDSTGQFVYVARGILKRIKELSDVVYYAVLCDEDEKAAAELSALRLKMLGVSAG